MSLLEAFSELEGSDSLHEGRLLLLVSAFSPEAEVGGIAGLTKLAKLDFLLRYPVLLERALTARGRSTRAVELQDFERSSVESRMVRYRFGPWDHRYRRFLNLLSAKGLIRVEANSRPVQITITRIGKDAANSLIQDEAFQDVSRRAAALKTHFDLQGSYLMRFIYETFPEIVSLKSNEAIDI